MTVRFKVDENLPSDVAALLRSAGYDADTVHDEGLASATDDHLAAVCREEGRAIVTLDTDFANVVVHPPHQSAGCVVLRLDRQDKRAVAAVLARLIPLFATESLAGRLWVVDEKRVRIHG